MNDDEFFQRLRGDARSLRHHPDEATLRRIRTNIEAQLAPSQPTVSQLLAAWFRPLLATAAAIAIAAAIGTNVVRSDALPLDETAIEISMGGETYRVGD
jgi:hypothetical protein